MSKKMIAIMKKEFARFFGDRRLVFTTILMPGLMIYIVYTLLGQGIGSSLLIWVATNSTGGDKLFGAWNLFSYSFRDIENATDITWLYGKGLCICIGLILLLALPKIVRKRG